MAPAWSQALLVIPGKWGSISFLGHNKEIVERADSNVVMSWPHGFLQKRWSHKGYCSTSVQKLKLTPVRRAIWTYAGIFQLDSGLWLSQYIGKCVSVAFKYTNAWESLCVFWAECLYGYIPIVFMQVGGRMCIKSISLGSTTFRTDAPASNLQSHRCIFFSLLVPTQC